MSETPEEFWAGKAGFIAHMMHQTGVQEVRVWWNEAGKYGFEITPKHNVLDHRTEYSRFGGYYCSHSFG